MSAPSVNFSTGTPPSSSSTSSVSLIWHGREIEVHAIPAVPHNTVRLIIFKKSFSDSETSFDGFRIIVRNNIYRVEINKSKDHLQDVEILVQGKKLKQIQQLLPESIRGNLIRFFEQGIPFEGFSSGDFIHFLLNTPESDIDMDGFSLNHFDQSKVHPGTIVYLSKPFTAADGFVIHHKLIHLAVYLGKKMYLSFGDGKGPLFVSTLENLRTSYGHSAVGILTPIKTSTSVDKLPMRAILSPANPLSQPRPVASQGRAPPLWRLKEDYTPVDEKVFLEAVEFLSTNPQWISDNQGKAQSYFRLLEWTKFTGTDLSKKAFQCYRKLLGKHRNLFPKQAKWIDVSLAQSEVKTTVPMNALIVLSDKFRAMANSMMQERKTGLLTIENNKEQEELFIKWLAGSEVVLNESNAFGLLSLADEHQVSQLFEECIPYILENVPLNWDTLSMVLEFSIRRNLYVLTRHCFMFAEKNRKDRELGALCHEDDKISEEAKELLKVSYYHHRIFPAPVASRFKIECHGSGDIESLNKLHRFLNIEELACDPKSLLEKEISPTLLTSIKCLNVGDEDMSLETLKNVLRRCPNVEDLVVCCKELDLNKVKELFNEFPQLRGFGNLALELKDKKEIVDYVTWFGSNPKSQKKLLTLTLSEIDDELFASLLPHLKDLQYLMIKKSTVTSIPIIDNLVFLVCEECHHLQSLSAPKIQGIGCYRCDGLTSVVAPNATGFKTVNCKNLHTVVALQAQDFECPGPNCVTEFHLPEAKEVRGGSSKLVRTVYAPKATNLWLDYCDELTTIDAKNAEEIWCCNDKKLTNLNAPHADLRCRENEGLRVLDTSYRDTTVWYLKRFSEPCPNLESILGHYKDFKLENLAELPTLFPRLKQFGNVAPFLRTMTDINKYVNWFNHSLNISLNALNVYDIPSFDSDLWKSFVPMLRHLEHFFVSRCAISSIPNADQLKTLMCRFCDEITSLTLAQVKVFDAMHCSHLTSVSLPHATEVSIDHCPALKTIDAPKAEILYVGNCGSEVTLNVPKTCQIRKFIPNEQIKHQSYFFYYP